MSLFKQLWFPFLIIVFPGLVFSLYLPYFPVDETRYLSVAWEMRLYDSFIVPIQNALPYSHKPPFLFWLFNLDWFLFGVNEVTLRLIPLLFSLLNITIVYKISLKLWNEGKIAHYAAIILSSTLSYLLWSALIMFDIVLTFWVLLAIYGLLSASGKQSIKSWLLIGIAIGGGILTKGPVVFVYFLPVVILSFLWVPKENFSMRWYAWFAFSLAVGVAVVFMWLIPAAMTGGESYREAILWGQTVNRVANSFAHQRPFWWYIPWLLALLLPWILLTPVWRGCSRLTNERGGRFLVIWIAPALIVLSLISGKQVHYLIPMLPPFSLLMAKNLSAWESSGKTVRWHYPVAAFYSMLGIVLLSMTFMKMGGAMEAIGISGARSLSFGLITIGTTLFFLKKQSTARLLNYTALSSAVFFVLILFSGNTFFDKYDLRGISQAIKEKQDSGYRIMHFGKYHGQYQFIGRLTQPLVPLDTKEAIGEYAANHDKVALITYEARTRAVNQEDVYFQQPFRSKKVVLWNRKGIAKLAKLPGVNNPENDLHQGAP
jgi:4-amino-4-deoxy-L-arabinose transferase-like glycosyltransferase